MEFILDILIMLLVGLGYLIVGGIAIVGGFFLIDKLLSTSGILEDWFRHNIKGYL